MPDDAALQAVLGAANKPPRQPSTVEGYSETAEQLLNQGCEMTAIFARLREDYGFAGSYSAVRRYVNQKRPPTSRVTMRVHTAPGEEAQVDLGSVGYLYDPHQGRPRLAYVFVATLSYSRHQYAELVFDQKIATWIGLHRRAFESWGGVPRRIVPDNLKAAVSRALIYDPVLGEAYRRMAQHCCPSRRKPFTLLAIRPVKVHPDCHVVIEGSYYSAPCRYVGQTLEAYIGEQVVQLFSGQQLLCTHTRALQPGEHHTRPEHYPTEMAEYLQRTPDYCRRLAAEIGPATQQVVQALLDDRSLDRLRSAQALLRLERSATARRLEAACARALYFGDGTFGASSCHLPG